MSGSSSDDNSSSDTENHLREEARELINELNQNGANIGSGVEFDEQKGVVELIDPDFDSADYEKLFKQVGSVDNIDYDDKIVKTVLDEVILMLILSRNMANGQEIISDIHKTFNTQLSPGTVYPVLHNLADDDILEKKDFVRTKEYEVKDRSDVAGELNRKATQMLMVGLVMKNTALDIESQEDSTEVASD